MYLGHCKWRCSLELGRQGAFRSWLFSKQQSWPNPMHLVHLYVSAWTTPFESTASFLSSTNVEKHSQFVWGSPAVDVWSWDWGYGNSISWLGMVILTSVPLSSRTVSPVAHAKTKVRTTTSHCCNLLLAISMDDVWHIEQWVGYIAAIPWLLGIYRPKTTLSGSGWFLIINPCNHGITITNPS